jgi:hypothetical protein
MRQKRTQRRGSTDNKALTIAGYWLVALFAVFLLIGSNARPILWVFILFAILSYYTLNKN